MYRQKQKQDMASAEVSQDPPANGHHFLHRVADLPLSKAAIDQFAQLYDRAQQQKVLAVGLKAGESTFKLAGYVASPVIHRLPVESFDSLACKQLDRLEYVAPVIKKEPEEIIAASTDLLNKAKAVPSNTVQAVKEAGINTISGVKRYAVETVTPTLEKVEQVKSYSNDTITSATTYSRDKINGVKATYEGVVSGELIRGYYDSVRGGVVNKYENLKSGVVQKYDGLVTGVSSIRSGVWEKYEGTKQGLYNYTADTFKPSVDRYKAAKQYSTDKVSSAYNGVRHVGDVVVDSVVNNRVVVGVREGRVGQALTNSLDSVLSYAENRLDETLPPVKATEGTLEVHPASPEAGSWTRTMVLVSNLRGRLYHIGQQRMKTYTVRAEEMMTTVNDYKTSVTKRMTTTYESSHAYLTDTYTSAKTHLTHSTTYLTDKYTAGHDFVSGTYKAGMDRMNRTSEMTRHYWVSLIDGASAGKERLYTTVHTVHTSSLNAKQRLTETWTSGRTKVHDTYEYMTELAMFGKDYSKNLVAPFANWLGLSKTEGEDGVRVPAFVARGVTSGE